MSKFETVLWNGVPHMIVKPADFLLRSSIIADTISKGRHMAVNMLTGELTTVGEVNKINKYRFELCVAGMVHRMPEIASKVRIIDIVRAEFDKAQNGVFLSYLNKPNKLIHTITSNDRGDFVNNVMRYLDTLRFEKIEA